MKNDSGSLDSLHDLVLPAPESWWPPAPGWMVVMAVLLLAILALLVTRFMAWQANRYRREALALLDDPSTPPATWSSILKRAALAVWPRGEVADLTGKDWLSFLDRTSDQDTFATGPANRLEDIAFAPAREADLIAMKSAARRWILHHRKEGGA